MLDQVLLQATAAATPTTLNITAADPAETLILKSISDLSAPKITLFTGTYAGNGGYYQGRRIEQRNPVFNFKLNPDYAGDVEVSEVRRKLYRTFLNRTDQVGDGLMVVLKDSKLPDLYFICNTEDINTDMWTREQTAQVSTLALDPFLRSVLPYHWDDTPGEMQHTFEYVGDAPTGLYVQLNVVNLTTQIHIRLQKGVEQQMITLVHPTGAFAAGSTVFVNTTELHRQVQYNGQDVMVMMSYDSDWLTLDYSEDPYTLEAWGTSYLDGKVLLSLMEYRGTWWGI